MARVLVVYTESKARTALVTLDHDPNVQDLLETEYSSARWSVAEVREHGTVLERFEREAGNDRRWRS